MTRLRHDVMCQAPGGWVRLTATFERQMFCNRVHGHPGPHRETDRHTFAVLAEWTTPTEPDPRTRRKVTT